MSTDSSSRLTGRVKWFNNKTGYGFITVTDGSMAGTDVFVHHSAIGVSDEQYKYLVQGEYVEFDMVSVPNGNHTHQAASVSGIKGGKLMCETRHETRVSRNNYKVVRGETENDVSPARPELTRSVTNNNKPVSRQGGAPGLRKNSGRGAGRGRGGSGRGSR